MDAGSNTQGAAPAAPSISRDGADLATAVGKIVARDWFKRMGNHTETHLSETQLALLCAAAAGRAVVALEVRYAG